MADLKGRRLSLPRRTRDSIDFWRANSLQVFETALASAGLGASDVKFVDLAIDRTFLGDSGGPAKDGSLWNAYGLRASQQEEIAALVQGRVDAIVSGGPRGIENQALLGAHVVYDLARERTRLGWTSNSFPYTLTVSGSLIKDRPDLVARLYSRVLAAAEWAKTHHDETVRIVAQELGVAEEFVELSFGKSLSQQLEVNLSPENVAALRLRKDFLLKHGFIQKDFDLDQWIDPAPLAEARRLLAERSPRANAKPKAEPALAVA